MVPFAARGILLGSQSIGAFVRCFVDFFGSNRNIIEGLIPVPKMAAVDYLSADGMTCYIASVNGRWMGKIEVLGMKKYQ